MVNELEVEGNSVERIEDYMVIDQEPSAVAEKQPAAAWPTSGEIELQGLCARYSSDGPTVLDHLAVTIKSGEKVGIVGRTGSGKSTLVSVIIITLRFAHATLLNQTINEVEKANDRPSLCSE